MVPLPALPVPVQLVPFVHDHPKITFGTGRFLQPAHGFRPNLLFQSLFADRGGFFFLGLQLGIIINGMLILLQLAFQFCQAFSRKGLFQRFLRRSGGCVLIPFGEAIFGIQKLIICEIRHDSTPFKNFL